MTHFIPLIVFRRSLVALERGGNNIWPNIPWRWVPKITILDFESNLRKLVALVLFVKKIWVFQSDRMPWRLVWSSSTAFWRLCLSPVSGREMVSKAVDISGWSFEKFQKERCGFVLWFFNTTIRVECQFSWYFILFGVPSLSSYACFGGLDDGNDHSPQIFIPSYKKKKNSIKLPLNGTVTFQSLALRGDFLYQWSFILTGA